MMSTKFPIPCLLLELSEQLLKHRLCLDLEWARRDKNQEADALTNWAFKGFDPGRRVHVDLRTFPGSSYRQSFKPAPRCLGVWEDAGGGEEESALREDHMAQAGSHVPIDGRGPVVGGRQPTDGGDMGLPIGLVVKGLRPRF